MPSINIATRSACPTKHDCGKLVVAANASEEAYLDQLAQKAEANRVKEFELVNTAGLKALEPSLQGLSALVSPCTGIIDSHALMLSYQADIEAAGGTMVFRTPVLEAAIDGHAVKLRTGGVEPAELEASLVVNATGHVRPGTSPPACPGSTRLRSRHDTWQRAAISV